MTSTMTHRDCTHPATKAGRAKCRRDRAANITAEVNARQAIIDAYRNDADADELLGMMAQIGIDINADLSLEELIAAL